MLDWLEIKVAGYQDSSSDERQESEEEGDGWAGGEELQTSLRYIIRSYDSQTAG